MAGCRINASTSHPLDSASASKCSTSAYQGPVASCTLMPPLLFASCLPAGCCVAPVVAPKPDSASRLCLNLFFAIWLLQLTMPHLSHRRRLSSSSRLCLATRHLRLSTHRRLITGCVVACCRCTDVLAVDVQASSPSSRLRLLPLVIVALGIPM
jgi:hypothetical protein